MEIKNFKLDELIPYEKNPRKNDDAVQYVAESIKQFGFKVPIIIDKNNIIIAGHTRYKASIQLGLEEVPCIIADDLTEEQVKAFRLADNKVSEKAEWDFELLEEELENIIDIDMEDFGFLDINVDFEDESVDTDGAEEYTTKVDVPQYQITGDEPRLEELVDDRKANELIEEIKKSNISDEQKQFLIKAAKRHLVFNYRNIAEYYAHQNKEMQELMEKSALIIIDYNDAIKYGYAQLSKGIEEAEGVDIDYDEI